MLAKDTADRKRAPFSDPLAPQEARKAHKKGQGLGFPSPFGKRVEVFSGSLIGLSVPEIGCGRALHPPLGIGSLYKVRASCGLRPENLITAT
jgi:hypothetical protein